MSKVPLKVVIIISAYPFTVTYLSVHSKGLSIKLISKYFRGLLSVTLDIPSLNIAPAISLTFKPVMSRKSPSTYSFLFGGIISKTPSQYSAGYGFGLEVVLGEGRML